MYEAKGRLCLTFIYSCEVDSTATVNACCSSERQFTVPSNNFSSQSDHRVLCPALSDVIGMLFCPVLMKGVKKSINLQLNHHLRSKSLSVY